MRRATLFHGNAATVIRECIAPNSVDMVYCDPPFGNEQIWTGAAGSFSDKWEWSDLSADGWRSLREHNPVGADLMAAITPWPKGRAYIGMMAGLLVAVHAAMSKRGTLWLHFDDTMGAHLRVLGDVVFGPENQFGTIIWKRSTGSKTAKAFARVHDTITCFGRSRAARARLSRIGGEFTSGGWDRPVTVEGYVEDRLAAGAAERVGYPTQKPTSLIRRFIKCGSLIGDTILDPTCGSGTALVAARSCSRRAIGIDVSNDALSAARKRLADQEAAQYDMFSEAA